VAVLADYKRQHVLVRPSACAPGSALRRLGAAPPRVPASVAVARPRVISVRAVAASDDRGVEVLATVDDGRRRYGIPLALRPAGRRWLVTAVSG
jgi:hypothetical protein